MQGDTIRNISGEFVGTAAPGGIVTFPFKRLDPLWGYAHLSDRKYQDNVQYEFNAAYTVPTANENRPINKAVYYLIKAN